MARFVELKAVREHGETGAVEQIDLLLPFNEVLNLNSALIDYLASNSGVQVGKARSSAASIKVDLKTATISVLDGEWTPTYPKRGPRLAEERKRDRKRKSS